MTIDSALEAVSEQYNPHRGPSANGTHERCNGDGKPRGTPATPDLWEPPVPFTDPPRPEFPVECLSVYCGNYVRALAEATQTPPDLAAMLILGVQGAALAKKFRVVARDGWVEPTNLYAVVALPPGNRKSAVFAEVLEPVKAFEQEELERLKPQIAEKAS